jgi:thioredoxin-related protein
MNLTPLKKIPLPLILTMLVAFIPCSAQESDSAKSPPAETTLWITGPDAALQQSARTRRPLLINFTGSDWCIWCHRVRDEIFVQKHFLDYAASNLVLLEVDSPRQTKLPAPLEKQNNALKEKYAVDSYPTLLLLDADGKELGRLGYMQGGPKTFVRELKRLIATSAAAGKPAPLP